MKFEEIESWMSDSSLAITDDFNDNDIKQFEIHFDMCLTFLRQGSAGVMEYLEIAKQYKRCDNLARAIEGFAYVQACRYYSSELMGERMLNSVKVFLAQ